MSRGRFSRVSTALRWTSDPDKRDDENKDESRRIEEIVQPHDRSLTRDHRFKQCVSR